MCMIRLDVLVPCALLSAVAAGAGPYHCPPSCPAQAQPVAAPGPGQTQDPGLRVLASVTQKSSHSELTISW